MTRRHTSTKQLCCKQYRANVSIIRDTRSSVSRKSIMVVCIKVYKSYLSVKVELMIRRIVNCVLESKYARRSGANQGTKYARATEDYAKKFNCKTQLSRLITRACHMQNAFKAPLFPKRLHRTKLSSEAQLGFVYQAESR